MASAEIKGNSASLALDPDTSKREREREKEHLEKNLTQSMAARGRMRAA